MYHVLECTGIVVLDGVEHAVSGGSVVFIPGDAEPGFWNTADRPLRFFYTFATRSPPWCAVFAMGTWVIAEVVRLVVTQVGAVGAGSGASLTAFSGLDPLYRIAYVYWVALGITVLVVLGVYLLMRSRLGLALTAIRDEPTAAGSSGVEVTRAKRLVFVFAAVGCGLAGAMIVANTLRVQPGRYSASTTRR